MSRFTESYAEEIRYQLTLLPTTTPDVSGFEQYLEGFRDIMRSHAAYLRIHGYPRNLRIACNNRAQALKPDYKQYLYKLNPRCAICGYVFGSIREVTIDHILARGYGGGRGIVNQQLAHSHCNVLKDADFNKVVAKLRPVHLRRGV